CSRLNWKSGDDGRRTWLNFNLKNRRDARKLGGLHLGGRTVRRRSSRSLRFSGLRLFRFAGREILGKSGLARRKLSRGYGVLRRSLFCRGGSFRKGCSLQEGILLRNRRRRTFRRLGGGRKFGVLDQFR